MNEPLISIIVPIYKAEAYLEKCVDSILAQTYTNIEVVLVDDGSPDGCPAICDAYREKDNRVVVIHQKNGGVSAARNAGLDVAKGELIGFVDSDDWIEPDLFEVLLEVMQSSDTDIAISSYCTDSRKPKKGSTNRYTTFTTEEAVQKILCDPERFLLVWGKLFSRRVIQNIRFDCSLTLDEDGLFVIHAIVNSKSVSYIDYKSYHHIYYGDSLSHAFRKDFWAIILRAIDLILDVIKKYDPKLNAVADKCAIEYGINGAKEVGLRGKISKSDYKTFATHISKHKNRDSWRLLSYKDKRFVFVLLLGRAPFNLAIKLAGLIYKAKSILKILQIRSERT